MNTLSPLYNVVKAIRFPLLLSCLVFSGCGVQIESVVDPYLRKSYVNPLIVLPYEGAVYTFTHNLKETLEIEFEEHNAKVQVLTVRTGGTDLTLNRTDKIDQLIRSAIAVDNKDLLLIFKPVKLKFSNYQLQSASYQLIGIDVASNKEIWKANFSSSGAFGPSTFSTASATQIYSQLVADKVLRRPIVRTAPENEEQ